VPKPAAAPDPQSRILDAAERAFADYGFDGTSMRKIVAAAHVNVATAYYHFGSKEGLLATVFNRRFGPVHEQQWQSLRSLAREFGRTPAPLERILAAMLLPPLRLADGTPQGEIALRLMGRVLADPNARAQRLLQKQYEDLRAAWLAAVQRGVPRLPKTDLWWRFELLWGAFVFVLCNPSRVEQLTGGVCDPTDSDAVLSQLLAVFVAGFHAPAAAKRSAANSRPRSSATAPRPRPGRAETLGQRKPPRRSRGTSAAS